MESFQQSSGCLHRLVSGPQVWPTAKQYAGKETGESGRAGYRIWGARCKMKMRGPCLKISKNFTTAAAVFGQVQGPSEHGQGAVGLCTSYALDAGSCWSHCRIWAQSYAILCAPKATCLGQRWRTFSLYFWSHSNAPTVFQAAEI